MSTVEEIERVIEQLSRDDFEKLAAWIKQRHGQIETSQPVQKKNYDTSKAYPGPDQSSGCQTVLRDHSAFLSSYAPSDEGLYDDAAAG